MIKEALRLSEAGLRVIPVTKDKRPLVKWQKFTKKQSENDIRNIFNSKTEGIALICGNGIEALDFDLKNDIDGDCIEKFNAFVKLP